MLEDIGAADDLFLNYLDQDIGTTAGGRESDVVGRAKRLADLYFNLFELDLERGVLVFWETATPLQRRAVLSVLRDHFAVFKEERALDDSPLMPVGWEDRLVSKYSALAERYRSLPFAKGELCVKLKIASRTPARPRRPGSTPRVLRMPSAKLGGPIITASGRAVARPKTAAQHAVETAEKLNLPRLRQYALTRLAWRALSREDYEAHVGYFRKGLDVIKTVPIRETMVGRASRRRYPPQAWFHMVLWRAGELNNKPGNEGEFDKGLALSRQYGGRPGELAYLIDAMKQFLGPGLFKDVAARAESLARRMDDKRLARPRADGQGRRPDRHAGIRHGDPGRDGSRRSLPEARRKRPPGRVPEQAGRAFRAQSDRFEEAARDFEESIKVYDERGLDDLAFSTGMDAGYYLRAQPVLAEKFYGMALAAAKKGAMTTSPAGCLYDRGRDPAVTGPGRGGPGPSWNPWPARSGPTRKAGRPGEDLGLMRQVGQALSRVGRFSEAIDIQKRRAEIAPRPDHLEADEADACFWLHQIYALDLGDISRGHGRMPRDIKPSSTGPNRSPGSTS